MEKILRLTGTPPEILAPRANFNQISPLTQTTTLSWEFCITISVPCMILGTGHGTTDWLQIGKGVCQGCILSPRLFNLYADYIMRNAGLEEAQAGIKIARRNINNPDMQITPPLWQKVKRN